MPENSLLADSDGVATALHAPADALGAPATMASPPRGRRHLPFLGWVAAAALAALAFLAVFAGWLAPYPYAQVVGATALQAPSADFLLGTDAVGRDVLSRLLYGTQVSLGVAVPSVLISLVVGSAIGLLAAWFRGWLDAVIVRFIDIVFAFPDVLLAIALVAVLGGGLDNLVVVIAILFTPRFAVVVRASALTVRNREFVEASQSLGAGGLWVTMRHIVPNIAPILLVEAALSMSAAMLAEAGLSFLGLGAPPPVPSWGGMLQEAQTYMIVAPWTAIWPSVAIVIAVLSINVLADALRQTFELGRR